MQTSLEIKNISKALLKFQSEMEPIWKDATNPHFKNKYASLTALQNAIQVPLSKCGLIVTQHPDGVNGLTSMLVHAESGEFFQSSFTMKPQRDDPQGVGSVITYARRYALAGILGLNIEEDDDANAASQSQRKSAPVDKPELLPGTDAWKGAVKWLKGKGAIDGVRTKYKLSKINEDQLKQDVLDAA